MAACAVLMGHTALLLLVWQARRLPADSGELRRTIVLRLMLPERRREHAARIEAAPPGVAPPAIPWIAPPALADGRTAAADEIGSGTQTGGTGPSSGVAASAAHGLNLKPSAAVLRGALANPATTDPRSNSPKPTFEERIAMGLDRGLCVKLERDVYGQVQRRMGRLVEAKSLLQSTHGVGARGVKVCE